MNEYIANLTTEDILVWIHRNCKDEEAMSAIAVAAYPYSKKFKDRYPDNTPDVHI